jgi:hypothetical protein
VIRDHDHHRPIPHHFPYGRQTPLEGLQLLVHSDPHRLEDARLVAGGRRPAERHGERGDEIVARLQGLGRTALHDLSCETPGPRLLAEVAEHLGEPRLARLREEADRVEARRLVHTHIQCHTPPEREAACFGLELTGADAEIQERAVQAEVTGLRVRRRVVEAATEEAHAWGKASEGGPRVLDRLGVPVHRQDATAAARLQDQARVGSPAQRAVQIETVPVRVEKLDGLRAQHRLVVGVHDLYPKSRWAKSRMSPASSWTVRA